jgi:DNA polymerase III gamma/tau subunit
MQSLWPQWLEDYCVMISLKEGGPVTSQSFLSLVYDIAQHCERDALDLILKRILTLTEEKKYNEIDQILNEVDFSRINTSLMLMFVSATGQAAKHLSNRTDYVNRAIDYLPNYTYLNRVQRREFAESMMTCFTNTSTMSQNN